MLPLRMPNMSRVLEDMNVTSIPLAYWNLSDYLIPTNATVKDKSSHSIYEIVLISLVAGFLSVVTVVGNMMVLISFKMDKQLQTISNYFLLSLAIADFAIGLISMPLFTVYNVLGEWVLGPFVCDSWLAMDYLMSNASVLNLLIISFDRYFSVTRPLTYRARRTTRRAIFMIASAWIISLILWPPWIYAWPYIEGGRKVPDHECYIQFLETNQYVTFGTAIAAFYFPVSIMIILYWRIWRETEKRQKDLTNLQAVKKDNSKRSTSSDEVVEQDEAWRRSRGDSTSAQTNVEDLETTYVPTALCIENPRYLKVPGRTKWQRWQEIIISCCRDCRIDRDTECAEEDSTSEAGHGSPGNTTPASAETPVQSSVSRCTSLSLRPDALAQSPSGTAAMRTGRATDTMIPLLDRSTSGDSRLGVPPASIPHPPRPPMPPPLPPPPPQPRSMSTDSVYTILIRFPPDTSLDCGMQPSIKMIAEEDENEEDESGDEAKRGNEGESPCLRRSDSHQSTLSVSRDYSLHPAGCPPPPPPPASRRPSQPPEAMKLPLNTKLMPRPMPKAPAVKKKKKKIQERKQDRKAAKTLSAILLAFIITWTPYNVLVLIRTLSRCGDECISKELWDFSYYLCYINSTINPLCYALCNASFRRTYIRILTCKWHTKKRNANRGYYN